LFVLVISTVIINCELQWLGEVANLMCWIAVQSDQTVVTLAMVVIAVIYLGHLKNCYAVPCNFQSSSFRGKVQPILLSYATSLRRKQVLRLSHLQKPAALFISSCATEQLDRHVRQPGLRVLTASAAVQTAINAGNTR